MRCKCRQISAKWRIGAVFGDSKTKKGHPDFDQGGLRQFQLDVTRLASEERENVLRILVRDLEHLRTRLNENLSTSEAGRFHGEVRVTDRAFRIGQVAQGVVERVDVRFERRALERTETTAKRSHFADHFVDDSGRVTEALVPMALAPPDLSS